MDESDYEINPITSLNSDQFEQNFSRLDLSRTVPYHQTYHYQSFQPVAPTQPHQTLYGQAPLLRSNSIPSNLSDQISDHINDIINKNESIVGRINRQNQQQTQRSGAQVRKRSIRGPWRYEERILQLGYKPSHQQRRNSLPVQSLTQPPRDLQRPYQQKQKFKRRASLPVIQASSEMTDPGSSSSGGVIRGLNSSETPTRVSVIIDNPTYRHPTSSTHTTSNVEPQKDHKSRSWNDLHNATQPETNGNDSDGSELIIVDDAPDYDADDNVPNCLQAAALLKRTNPDELSDDDIRSDTSNRLQPSVIKDRMRSFPSDDIQSPILSKKVKTEYEASSDEVGLSRKTSEELKFRSEVPKNVMTAVEEVKLKALLSTKTGNSSQLTNVAVVNPFRKAPPQITPGLQTEGGTPNAVIKNPIRTSNPNQILDRSDIDGRPFGKGELDSDDEDSRPFKCHECQKGFRISGHLARHNKAEIHMKRLQELRELGIQPTSGPPPQGLPPVSMSTSVIQTAEPVPVISDRTVSSTTVDIPPRSQTPESEDGEGDMGARKFPCLTCNVAFRFQGHLDRHYRSTMHQSMVEAMEGRVSSSIHDGGRVLSDVRQNPDFRESRQFL